MITQKDLEGGPHNVWPWNGCQAVKTNCLGHRARCGTCEHCRAYARAPRPRQGNVSYLNIERLGK